jgi:hypothetical protein
MTTSAQHLQRLRDRGFDQTTRNGKYLRPKCSQCETLVINGVACHEAGCPNATRTCKGCNAPVRASGPGYCEDCQ